jgi:hypothetical protein
MTRTLSMSKADRIDPLVHYSRQVRDLQAKIAELKVDKVVAESTIQTLREQLEHYRTLYWEATKRHG